MTNVNIIVREIGGLKPDYSLDFDLPEIPAIGSYISIQRPDKEALHGEDLIVRRIWWRLIHPETSGYGSEPPKVGSVNEIFIECDVAIGPYSSDRWRGMAEAAIGRGISIEKFEVARYSVRESDLRKAVDEGND